ncbi:unnamed protein product [Calicophoron daubneyi]
MVRVGLNVTILSMVNETSSGYEATNNTPTCGILEKKETIQHSVGSYIWSRPIQGLILGAFFWGYLVTQIPGTMLTLYFGPRLVGLTLLLGFSISDICLPYIASLGYQPLIALRILEGLFEGAMMPLMACLIGRWVPPNERSRFTAFIFSGCQIGTVCGQVIAGFLSQTREYTNKDSEPTYISYWSTAHYLFGNFGLAMSALWMLTVYDNPEKHPRISNDELNYLRTNLTNGEGNPNLATEDSKAHGNRSGMSTESTSIPELNRNLSNTAHESIKPVPWRRMLCCRALWSILICHLCNNWAFYILLTCLPIYMFRVQGFRLSENGLLSSIPYVVQGVAAQVVGFASDALISHRILSVTWVRKLNNLIALGGAGSGLLAVGLVGCNRTAAVVLLTITLGLLGFSNSGFSANMVDAAPAYAGNIMSLTNTLGTLPGIFSPILVGALTNQNSSLESWMIIFSASAAICWLGAILNLFLTDGRLQPWAKPGHNENTEQYSGIRRPRV